MAKKTEIRALFSFEILGRPPEHVKESLEKYVDRMETIKGVKIESKRVHEPKPVENEKMKGLFTSFAEVEISTESIEDVISITIHMLPAHIEIISPGEISISNFDLGSALSTLAIKLHRYDEIAKAVTIQRNQALIKMKELYVELQKLKKDSGEKLEEKSKAEPKEKSGKKPGKKSGKKSKKKTKKDSK